MKNVGSEYLSELECNVRFQPLVGGEKTHKVSGGGGIPVKVFPIKLQFNQVREILT